MFALGEVVDAKGLFFGTEATLALAAVGAGIGFIYYAGKSYLEGEK